MSMRAGKEREAASAAREHLNEPVTADGLKKAWNEFAKAHSSEPALSNAMNKYLPEQAPDGRWLVAVDSVVTSNLLMSEFEQLIPYLRKALRNDDFNINVTISSNGIPPEYWSDTQVLNQLLENPEFAEFYNFLHLTMR